MPTVNELSEIVHGYKPNDTIAYSIWTVDDVEQVFKESYSDQASLTDEEKEDVLEKVQHHFDANIGINWEIIRIHISSVLAERNINEPSP